MNRSCKPGLRWKAGLALLVAGRAFAAGASPPDQASTAGSLEEIVVTAERREVNLQKSALTIEVLNGGDLQNAGISQASDLQTVTPGMTIGLGGDNDQIFIRGVGSFAYSPISTPGVAFNVDGVYVGRPDGLGSNFYDVSRVEVLKGPQGTLYGRNANGGSINVITNEPKLGDNSAYIATEFGNFNLVHVDGAANADIGGASALRLAFNVIRRSGYLSDGTGDDVESAGRLRYKFQPSDAISLLFNTDYAHLGGRGGGSVWLPRPPGANPWDATTTPASNAYLHSFLPLGPLVANQEPDSFQDSSFFNTSAQLDWDVGIGKLTLLPAYRHTNTDSVSQNGLRYGQVLRADQKSLETRLGDTSATLTWVVGAYFFDESVRGSSNVYESNALQYYLIHYLPTTKTSAAFGQTTINLRGDLRLIVGGRYTREHDTLTGAIDNLATNPTSLLEAFGGNKTFSGFTYKGGFEYDLAPANMLYVTYSTGFKSGGFSQTVAPLNVYQPEKLDSLEFGSKNRFLDNRLQVNLTAYQWKYKHIQDQRVNFDPLGNVNLITYNSGDATIAGATVDVIGKLTDADTLSLSTEYAISHYTSYFFQEPAPVFQPASTGCNITGPYAPGAPIPYSSAGYTTNIDPTPIVVGNCAGFQVARVPLWSGTVGLQHVFNLPGSATLRAGAQMHFVDAEWLNIDFISAERARSYELIDADLTYAAPRWSVGLFGRNLGNTAYYTGGLQQTFIAGLFAANIGPPRTYGVHADYHFGGK